MHTFSKMLIPVILLGCSGGKDSDSTGSGTGTGTATGTATATGTGTGSGTGTGTGTGSGTSTTAGTPTGVTTGSTTTVPRSASSGLGFVVDWTNDGYTPTDTDGDGLPDAGCDDSLSIEILDPLAIPSWSFGIAETQIANGWTGEDCLNGYGSYTLCHTIGLTATLNEVSSCQASDVVAGSTTLFHAEQNPFVTYMFHDGSYCFAFGNDPAYYQSLGCFQL